MTDLLYLAVAVGVLGLWPLPAAVAVVVAWGLAYRSPRATSWRSWLHRGHNTPETPWLLLATVAVTALALLAWQQVFHGQLPDAYRDAAQGQPVWLVLVQAAAFGLLHVVGIPTGLVGALMTGSWGGVLLGVMRHRTQGILAPYLAHIAADLTIVIIVLPGLT